MTSKTLSDLYALVHIIFRTVLRRRHNYYHHSHFTEGNWNRNCHVINERQSQDSNSSLMDPKFLCLITKVYNTICPHSYRKPRYLVKRRIWVHRDLGSRSKSVFILINCFPGLSTGGEHTHNLKVENYVLFDRLSEDNKPGKQPLRLLWSTAPKRWGRSQDI